MLKIHKNLRYLFILSHLFSFGLLQVVFVEKALSRGKSRSSLEVKSSARSKKSKKHLQGKIGSPTATTEASIVKYVDTLVAFEIITPSKKESLKKILNNLSQRDRSILVLTRSLPRVLERLKKNHPSYKPSQVLKEFLQTGVKFLEKLSQNSTKLSKRKDINSKVISALLKQIPQSISLSTKRLKYLTRTMEGIIKNGKNLNEGVDIYFKQTLSKKENFIKRCAG